MQTRSVNGSGGVGRLGEHRRSRRGFLGYASATAFLASGALFGTRQARAATEQLPELYAGANVGLFNEIRIDEESHVSYFVDILGSAARPMPTFQNLMATDLYDFAIKALFFENLGVHAYLGAAAYINNRALLGGVATVMTVEARHASYLNALGNEALVPYGVPFDFPLPQTDVVNALSYFIASLNGGPAPGFSTTDLSDQNDIAIGNYALAAEYAERAFYDMNVPRFF
jgi:hypothetical protein